MKKLRVALLVHEDFLPPDDLGELPEKEREHYKTEHAVHQALLELGHEPHYVAVSDDLGPIRGILHGWKPDVSFNLIMEFRNIGALQVHIASYLELLGASFTGCNSAGILLTRDKVLSKKILRFHRIRTPRFALFRQGRVVRKPAALRFPLIVKSKSEEASLGISQASIVRSEEKLAERVAFIHENVEPEALAEEYIEGRELTVSVLGNERLTTFPPWELFFRNLPESSEAIATERAKFDLAYQKRAGIENGPADPMPDDIAHRIATLARRVYRACSLSGYARVDLRLTEEEKLYVIEVNATPDLSRDEDLALSAAKAGIPYERLIQRILNLGIRYQAPWSGWG